MTNPGPGKKSIPTPEEEAERGTYRQNGNFVVKAIGFKKAMIKASPGYRVGKMPLARVISGALLLIDEWCILLDPKTKKPLTAYEIDIRRVVVQRQGILRARPKFPNWAVELGFEYDEDLLTEKIIKEILMRAGMLIGVFENSPTRGGEFGRFEVR